MSTRPTWPYREISLLLIRALQHHAGLDWYEAADVFDRVAQIRPVPPAADEQRLDELSTRMRPLLALPTEARAALFGPEGPLQHATSWLESFTRAGRQLGEAATDARLGRGSEPSSPIS